MAVCFKKRVIWNELESKNETLGLVEKLEMNDYESSLWKCQSISSACMKGYNNARLEYSSRKNVSKRCRQVFEKAQSRSQRPALFGPENHTGFLFTTPSFPSILQHTFHIALPTIPNPFPSLPTQSFVTPSQLQ